MNRFSMTLGNTKLATLSLAKADQPFYYYHFEPTEAFAEFLSLFEAELRSLNSDDMKAWELEYRQIASIGFTLISDIASLQIADIILHIEGETAWLRVD